MYGYVSFIGLLAFAALADPSAAVPAPPAAAGYAAAGHPGPKVPAFPANVFGPPQSLHLHVIPTKQAYAAPAPAAYAAQAAPAAAYAAAPAPAPAAYAAAGHATQFTAYSSLAKGHH